MAGDGQVTLEHTIMKHTAKKVRKIYHDSVLAGFAEQRLMPLPFLQSLRRSWNSIMEI